MVAYSETRDGRKLSSEIIYKELQRTADCLGRLFEAVMMAKSYIQWSLPKLPPSHVL